ncbi:MAG: glycosyltransferase family 2 protein [Pseudomonadota bacterium]
MTVRTMIFIPTFNCEKQIPRVLSKIDSAIQQYIEEVVIVDNRSTDNTIEAAIAGSAGISKKLTILKNNQNYNLGGSIKRAFLYAIENKYDYMITLHGDDQADIRDFLPLLQSGEYKNEDLVIGARFHKKSTLQGYSVTRILGNRVLNVVCSVINRRRVDDLIAGINCFKIDFFKNKFFLNFPDNLTFDAHVLLYAFNKKANVKYVPITWREEDQVSNAKVVSQALIILKLFFRYAFTGDKIFSESMSGRPIGFEYTSEVVYQK